MRRASVSICEKCEVSLSDFTRQETGFWPGSSIVEPNIEETQDNVNNGGFQRTARPLCNQLKYNNLHVQLNYVKLFSPPGIKFQQTPAQFMKRLLIKRSFFNIFS